MNESCEKEIDCIIEKELSSSVCTICFGAMGPLYVNGESGAAEYAFQDVMRKIPVNKIFLRDRKQIWYQGGIFGMGGNISESAHSLSHILHAMKAEKILCIGASSGAYAAIVFGYLLGAHHIIAFSPRTTLRAYHLLCMRDSRRKACIKLMRQGYPEQKYSDLLSLLQQNYYAGKIDIYYSKHHRLDKAHARRMNKLPVVTLHECNEGGHFVVRSFKQNGDLGKIITLALGVSCKIESGLGSPIEGEKEPDDLRSSYTGDEDEAILQSDDCPSVNH